MRKLGNLLLVLVAVSWASPAAAQMTDMAPVGDEGGAVGEPRGGIGISNQLNLVAAQIGAPGEGVPFSTLTGKFFIGDRMAAEGNFGLSIINPEQDGADSSTIMLIGGKFHYALWRLDTSHFFINGGFHFVSGSNTLLPLEGGGLAFAGDFTAINFGINLGWEYIFRSGLPGLGISPEMGLNFTYLNPDGDNNNITAFQLNGYGREFPFFLMNIRYYFM